MKEQRFHPDKPKNEIIKRLRFDEKQIAEYDLIIAKHREQMHELVSQIQEWKKDLYSQLTQTQALLNQLLLLRF